MCDLHQQDFVACSLTDLLGVMKVLVMLNALNSVCDWLDWSVCVGMTLVDIQKCMSNYAVWLCVFLFMPWWIDDVDCCENTKCGTWWYKKGTGCRCCSSVSPTDFLVEQTSEIKSYFTYQLTPASAPVFWNSSMHKPDKSSLARHLIGDTFPSALPAPEKYMVDGVVLLQEFVG